MNIKLLVTSMIGILLMGLVLYNSINSNNREMIFPQGDIRMMHVLSEQ